MKGIFFLLLFFSIYSVKAQPAATNTVHLAEDSIVLPGNLTLSYIQSGTADAPPVIFLHGLSDSWKSFEKILQDLPRGLRAIAITQRGHGNSAKPEGSYHPAVFAKDLAAFMDQKKIESAIIVGHSLGGIVAQHFAVEFPARVRGLVLVSTFANLNDNEAVNYFISEVNELKDPIARKYAHDFQIACTVQPVDKTYFNELVNESMKVPARVWKAIAGQLPTVNYLDQLSKFQKPALIIWGDKDGFASRIDQEKLSAALPRSAFKIYTNTGHSLHWEQPRKFTQDLLEFISEVNLKTMPESLLPIDPYHWFNVKY